MGTKYNQHIARFQRFLLLEDNTSVGTKKLHFIVGLFQMRIQDNKNR